MGFWLIGIFAHGILMGLELVVLIAKSPRASYQSLSFVGFTQAQVYLSQTQKGIRFVRI